MLRLGLVFGLLFVAACGSNAPCGVSWDGAEPELGTLILSDGTILTNGSWADTRINAGTLTIDVRAMAEEPTLAEALEGDFPVCRTLDDQNDAIIYQDNGPWITNASNTGTLAITERTEDEIKGRFEATIKSTSGEQRPLSGAFYVPTSR